ncbi:hypothetical protein [Parafrankia discariae]|uniref:hypothetical protein n=1 Tax=Parafrankia discariae TaxID=365528 RepID=UPI0003822711|nr:hypothetical protein [Parafrankia discariae]
MSDPTTEHRRAPGEGADIPAIGHPAHVVDDPAEITPEWMAEGLRGGDVGAVEVTGLRHEPIGTGQMGSSYRFHLEYAADRTTDRAGSATATDPPAPAPASVVVKMVAGDPAGRDVARRGYRKEVGFYSRLAGISRARTPRCWQAAITPDSRSFTLVLADAHPARPGSLAAGCDARQAADAARNLAGLHAPFWNSELLDAEAFWLERPGDAELAFMGELHVIATTEFVERFRDLGSLDLVEDA